MVMIGELAFRARFDGRELSRGLMSTRSQARFAATSMDEMKSASERLREGMDRIEKLTERYPQLAVRKLEFERRLRIEVLEHEKALRGLNREQERSLTLLQKEQASYSARTGLGKPTQQPGGPQQQTRSATFAMMTPRLLAGGAALATVRSSLASAADVERTENLLSVLTGSRVAAKGLISDMRELSKSTGIKMTGLQDAAKTMIGFGVDVSKVAPMLTRLGDIAGGDSQRMQGLALAFSQVAAMGRLQAEELSQMVERGFNPLAEMARTTGQSMADLRKRMSDGRISFAEFEAAVVSATASGGRFHRAAAAGNAGLAGAFNKLSTDTDMLSTKFGESLAPAANTFIDALRGGVGVLESYLPAIDNVSKALAGAADLAKGIIPQAPAVRDSAGAAVKNIGNPIANTLALGPDLVTMFTARARGLDEGVGMDAADRVRNMLGKGFFSEDNNARIDKFQADRKAKSEAVEKQRADKAKRIEAQSMAVEQAQAKEQARKDFISGREQSARDQSELARWNKDNAANPELQAKNKEELAMLKSLTEQEKLRLHILTKQNELLEKLDPAEREKMSNRIHSPAWSGKEQLAFIERELMLKSLTDQKTLRFNILTKQNELLEKLDPAEREKMSNRIHSPAWSGKEQLAFIERELAKRQEPAAEVAFDRDKFIREMDAQSPRNEAKAAPSLRVGSQAAYEQLTKAQLGAQNRNAEADRRQQQQLAAQQEANRLLQQQTSVLQQLANDLQPMGNAG